MGRGAGVARRLCRRHRAHGARDRCRQLGDDAPLVERIGAALRRAAALGRARDAHHPAPPGSELSVRLATLRGGGRRARQRAIAGWSSGTRGAVGRDGGGGIAADPGHPVDRRLLAATRRTGRDRGRGAGTDARLAARAAARSARRRTPVEIGRPDPGRIGRALGAGLGHRASQRRSSHGGESHVCHDGRRRLRLAHGPDHRDARRILLRPRARSVATPAHESHRLGFVDRVGPRRHRLGARIRAPGSAAHHRRCP